MSGHVDSYLFFSVSTLFFSAPGSQCILQGPLGLALNETGRKMPLAVTCNTAVPPASWSLELCKAKIWPQWEGHSGLQGFMCRQQASYVRPNQGKGILESERAVGCDAVYDVDITCFLGPWGQCCMWTWACLAG